MAHDEVILVDGISKAYRIWDSPSARLTSPSLATVGRLFPGESGTRRWLQEKAHKSYRDFWALRDVSFSINREECVGTVGRNGSGKSTLLQIIAGTLQPTAGALKVKGRVAALLELGSGFNQEFTGRENVLLNFAILGVTGPEIAASLPQIEAFADNALLNL